MCHTARHALSLIATARPPAVITALSKEVGCILIEILFRLVIDKETLLIVKIPRINIRFLLFCGIFF